MCFEVNKRESRECHRRLKEENFLCEKNRLPTKINIDGIIPLVDSYRGAHISMVKSVILQNWVKNVKKFQTKQEGKWKDTVFVWQLL